MIDWLAILPFVAILAVMVAVPSIVAWRLLRGER